MAGSEPPDRSGAGGPGDEGSGAHRWHDRDTEPIPRARNDVPPPEPAPVYEEVVDDVVTDPFIGEDGEPLHGGGTYYEDPPRFTDEELSGLHGGDPGPS